MTFIVNVYYQTPDGSPALCVRENRDSFYGNTYGFTFSNSVGIFDTNEKGKIIHGEGHVKPLKDFKFCPHCSRPIKLDEFLKLEDGGS